MIFIVATKNTQEYRKMDEMIIYWEVTNGVIGRLINMLILYKLI